MITTKLKLGKNLGKNQKEMWKILHFKMVESEPFLKFYFHFFIYFQRHRDIGSGF